MPNKIVFVILSCLYAATLTRAHDTTAWYAHAKCSLQVIWQILVIQYKSFETSSRNIALCCSNITVVSYFVWLIYIWSRIIFWFQYLFRSIDSHLHNYSAFVSQVGNNISFEWFAELQCIPYHILVSIFHSIDLFSAMDGSRLPIARQMEAECRICRKDFKVWHHGRVFKTIGLAAHEQCIVSQIIKIYFNLCYLLLIGISKTRAVRTQDLSC